MDIKIFVALSLIICLAQGYASPDADADAYADPNPGTQVYERYKII